MDSIDFEQQVALVTGGTKGIGRAITEALLPENARVLVTYCQDQEAAQDFVRALKPDQAARVCLRQGDIADRAHVQSLFHDANAEFGDPVSLVVNNAGILHQGSFQDLDDDGWDRTLAVNLKGPFMVGQEFLKSGPTGGAVVNIASVGGQTGGAKAPDYAASKAGLISLTRSLARLGSPRGIRVNAVAPGWIATEIFDATQLANLTAEAASAVPLGRLGTPAEVAQSVVFLLSTRAAYITGHCLNVNGGLYFG